MSSNTSAKGNGNQEGGLVTIHPQADTELGRLLSGQAVTPFTVIGFPGPHEGGVWLTFDEAVGSIYPNYLRGENPLADASRNKQHEAWLGPYDEDRVAMIMRQKIECNPYLHDLLAVSDDAFLFVDDEGNNIPRFHWLERELNNLRRYFRKSHAQGHKQPYVRPGRKRPYIWR